MATPDKWLFYVGSGQGDVCFKLAMHPEKRQNCGLTSLGSSLRYFVTGYPVDKSWTSKTPEFAYRERAVFEKLATSGYKQVWSIRGGLLSTESNDAPVEHTVGRKRRRQPTINQDPTEAEENITVGQCCPNQSMQQTGSAGYKHGVLIGLPRGDIDSRIEISKILNEHGFEMGIELKMMSDEQWMCEHGGQKYQLVKGISSADTPLPVHPAFRDAQSNFLFHSLDEVLDVLEKCPAESPVKGIRELVEALDEDDSVCPTHPFIVVEGLDATGKSTLVKSLVERLGSVQLETPPKAVSALRDQFDLQPTLIRRVCYSAGNYLAGKEVLQNCITKPAIMDRYWHSTAAYTIASHCSGEVSSLPPPDSYVYQWPRDLPRPRLVLLLSVNEEERRRRMAGRIESMGEALTKEEGSLQRDRLLRERILECYRRMREPKVIEISADGSKENVLEAALHQLRVHDIPL